jgi:hypothetical protein
VADREAKPYAPLPEDWREWASDDPKYHTGRCGCLDGTYCVLQLDAHQWRQANRG